MSLRKIAILVVGIIIAVEMVIFILQPTPVVVTTEASKNGSLFGRSTTAIDHETQQNQNTKFGIIILGTIAIGSVIIFAVPNNK